MQQQPDCKEAKLVYLDLKHQFLDDVAKLDRQIDSRSKRTFNANSELFVPLKGHSSVVFESGGMSSFISL